ncbi:unannotated protein [freshwater metagenome]|uniref:Unannotated protein n=1 Tax=freshwater metagenome TaxID=449393 RepID=A0A6J7S955_9ZZZZ
MPVKRPQGHGFAAKTKVKRDGKFALAPLREIVIEPDSSGWRKASKTPELISGASSKNKTPLCAREHAPGLIFTPPPPTSAARVAL